MSAPPRDGNRGQHPSKILREISSASSFGSTQSNNLPTLSFKGRLSLTTQHEDHKSESSRRSFSLESSGDELEIMEKISSLNMAPWSTNTQTWQNHQAGGRNNRSLSDSIAIRRWIGPNSIIEESADDNDSISVTNATESSQFLSSSEFIKSTGTKISSVYHPRAIKEDRIKSKVIGLSSLRSSYMSSGESEIGGAINQTEKGDCECYNGVSYAESVDIASRNNSGSSLGHEHTYPINHVSPLSMAIPFSSLQSNEIITDMTREVDLRKQLYDGNARMRANSAPNPDRPLFGALFNSAPEIHDLLERDVADRPAPSQLPTSLRNHRTIPLSGNISVSKLSRSKKRSNDAEKLAAGSTTESYNIYDKKVSRGLQDAWDAVFGMPFRGSLAFIAILERSARFSGLVVKKKTQMLNRRFCGPASVTMDISEILELDYPMVFTSSSAGYDDGNFAKLSINCKDVGKCENGINMLIYDVQSHQAQLATFDTHSVNGNEEVVKLAKFHEQHLSSSSWSSGYKIVAIAVKDESTKNLKAAGRRLLQSLGIEFPHGDSGKTMKELVESCRIPSERTPSLLNLCAKANAVSCAQVLVQNGWRIDYRPKHGLQNTALHDAIFHGSLEVAYCLLFHGASYRIRNKTGETADDMLKKNFNISVSQLMEQKKHLRTKLSSVSDIDTRFVDSVPNNQTSDDDAVLQSILNNLDI